MAKLQTHPAKPTTTRSSSSAPPAPSADGTSLLATQRSAGNGRAQELMAERSRGHRAHEAGTRSHSIGPIVQPSTAGGGQATASDTTNTQSPTAGTGEDQRNQDVLEQIDRAETLSVLILNLNGYVRAAITAARVATRLDVAAKQRLVDKLEDEAGVNEEGAGDSGLFGGGDFGGGGATGHWDGPQGQQQAPAPPTEQERLLHQLELAREALRRAEYRDYVISELSAANAVQNLVQDFATTLYSLTTDELEELSENTAVYEQKIRENVNTRIDWQTEQYANP